MQESQILELRSNWEAVKGHIRKEYGLADIAYNTWIRNLSLGGVRDGVVTILIPSDQSYALSYISGKYKDYFQVTLSEMLGKEAEVNFALEQEEVTPPPAPLTPSETAERTDNANLMPKLRFDNFIVGSNNKFA